MTSARIRFCTCCFVFIPIYLFILCAIVIPLQKPIYFCTLFHFSPVSLFTQSILHNKVEIFTDHCVSVRFAEPRSPPALRRFPLWGRGRSYGGGRGRRALSRDAAQDGGVPLVRRREPPVLAEGRPAGSGGLRVPRGWARAALMLAAREDKAGGCGRGESARPLRPRGSGQFGLRRPGRFRCRGPAARRCCRREPRVQSPVLH